jgi:hypothetical protein
VICKKTEEGKNDVGWDDPLKNTEEGKEDVGKDNPYVPSPEIQGVQE